jgi:hypothetical protein
MMLSTTKYDPDDIHMCDLCNKEFIDNDTYWKCSCRGLISDFGKKDEDRCQNGCCMLHRVEETGDYDDHCICVKCAGWCHLCLSEEERLEPLAHYKTFCSKCRKVVCQKHFRNVGYCAVECLSCNSDVNRG